MMTGGIDDKILKWAVKGHTLTTADLAQFTQSSMRHFLYTNEHRKELGGDDFVKAFWEFIEHIKGCGGCKMPNQGKILDKLVGM